jgi:hypothetical protein
MSNDSDPALRKSLGRLLTTTGRLICGGDAQLNSDGSGLFVPEAGTIMREIDGGHMWIIRTFDGENIRVTSLRELPSTPMLPKRYSFLHNQRRSFF